MHIKRFEAETMEEALAQVRETLGPDALILSSRTVQRGGSAFGLFSRRVVEIQAARPRAQEREAAAAAAGAEEGSEREGADPGLASVVDALRRELAVLRRRESFEEEVRGELRGLRAAIGQFVGSRPDAEFDRAVCSLAGAGLDWIHAQSLVEEWRGRRSEGESFSLERILCDRLAKRLVPPRADTQAAIRIVVGAPGAGKTTTLAKLAGRGDEGEREVAFVSLDAFRIGAREQLRAYAGLLDSPYCELSSADALNDVVRRHPGRALFVDTAGRSPADGSRLGPLEAIRSEIGRESTIELVVDATSRRDVARAQLARFGGLAPDRLILTRLDECDSLAPVVNLLLDDRCPPLCWLGTGQRVPEDLEIAEPAFFAQNVMSRAA